MVKTRAIMASVIRGFAYSKVAGRGRGILGLSNFKPCRKPGQCGNAAGTNPQKQGKLSLDSDDQTSFFY